MNVRDLDEFMADIDEWVLDDVERWEDEKGGLNHLILKLEKPITEEEVEIFVDAHVVQESSSLIPNPRDGENRAFVFGASSHYLLTLNKGQDKSIPASALNFAHESLMDSAVDKVQKVLDKQYRLEVILSGR